MELDAICCRCMKKSAKDLLVCPHCGGNKQFGQTSSRALPIRTILHGRYLVGRELGVGGYGITYLGLCLDTEQVIAIKECMPERLCSRAANQRDVIRSNGSAFEYALKHFRVEVEALQTLNDLSGTPTCLDSFYENNTAYYVMEYLKGVDLFAYLNAHGKMTYEEALRVILPIIVCLQTIHERGILHRDISPDNIILCEPKQEPKLIDFGSAQNNASNIADSFTPTVKWAYAPPEQFTNKRTGDTQTIRSDEYSLAATLYRCITGKATVTAVSRDVGERLPTPSELGAACDKNQDMVLMKALSMEPGDRYESVAQFGTALINALPSEGKKRKLAQQFPALSGGSLRRDEEKEQRYTRPQKAPERVAASRASRASSASSTALKRFAAWLLDYALIPSAVTLAIGYSPINLIASVLTAVMIAGMFEHALSASFGWMATQLTVQREGGAPPRVGQALLHSMLRLLLAPFTLAAHLLRQREWLADQICRVAVSERRKLSKPSEEAPPPEPPSASEWLLEVTAGQYRGTCLPLERGQFVIGRDPTSCQLAFPQDCKGVSGVHCLLWVKDDGSVEVTDLHSTFGTFLGGSAKPLEPGKPYPLQAQECIKIGNEEMKLITRGDLQ